MFNFVFLFVYIFYKVNDFPELSRADLMEINLYTKGPEGDMIITKYLDIYRYDINKLKPKTWLDDKIINVYMKQLEDRSINNRNFPRFFSLDAFFLLKLSKMGYDGVKDWIKDVNIFSYDILAIPVFHEEREHWCLIIIFMQKKVIRYYDSVLEPEDNIQSMIFHFLNKEHEIKEGKILNKYEWKLENANDIPIQRNNYDCGVYCCLYAELISRARPLAFTQKHINYFRKRMILEICRGELFIFK